MDADEIDSEKERNLRRALATLRWLGSVGDPLTVAQAVARGHVLGDEFKEWEKSGAPINEVIVRTVAGGHMTIERKDLDTHFCMYAFATPLQRDEVLHFYKKGDMDYDEVLLHRVIVSQLGSKGYPFKKKYLNGQTLKLNVTPNADGAYEIAVQWTKAQVEHQPFPWDRLNIWLFLVAPLLALGGFLWHRFGRGVRYACVGLAFGVLATTAAQYQFSANRGQGHDAPIPAVPVGISGNANAPSLPTDLAGIARHTLSAGVDVNSPAAAAGLVSAEALAELLKCLRGEPAAAAGTGAPAGRVKVVKPRGRRDRGSSVGLVTLNSNTAERRPRGSRAALMESCPMPGAEPRPDEHQEVPPPALRSLEESLIEVYVTAHVKEDPSLSAEMLAAFTDALKRTQRFVVLTDRDDEARIEAAQLRVDLWYTPKERCDGEILAEVYDNKSNEYLWKDRKYCKEYPKGELLKDASRQIAHNMASKVAGAKAEESKRRESD